MRKAVPSVQNLSPEERETCFRQINYTLTDVPEDRACFHTQFRRVSPLPYKEVYTILDQVKGRGRYFGTVMGRGIRNNKWRGEGEIKFYPDGDGEFPTIRGTGTEDSFGNAHNWEVDGQYVTCSPPFTGMHQVIRPDGVYQTQHCRSMYRRHIMEPIRLWKTKAIPLQKRVLAMPSLLQCAPFSGHDRLPVSGNFVL